MLDELCQGKTDTLSCFGANQSLFLLLNTAFIAEKTSNFNCITIGSIRQGHERTYDLSHSMRACYPLKKYILSTVTVLVLFFSIINVMLKRLK